MPEILVSTDGMSREDWLAQRVKFIGGSDAAAAIGLSRWKDPLTLWAEKTGRIKPEEAGEAAYWGNVLEPLVAQRFSEVTGLSVRRKNAILVHEEFPFMCANLDRVIVGKNQILEIKTASAYKGDEWEEDEIPLEYYCQGQHYLAVTGCDGVYYAVLIGGQRFHHIYAPRDEEFIAEMMKAEKEFWGYVERNEQPPVNARKFVSKDLRRPVYECACIREGNGYATDTHVMLIVNDVWEKKKSDLLYNMHSKELVEQMKFVDKQGIEKVIPKIESSPIVVNVLKKNEQSINPLFPLAMWMKSSIAIIKKVDRKNPTLRVHFTATSMLFSFDTQEVKTECSFEFMPETSSFLFKEWEKTKSLTVYFNGVLFLSALEALLEFDCKEINFAFTGPLTPFALYGDKYITAVITPMRVG